MAVPPEPAARAARLRHEIELANFNYYVRDSPSIPDVEYDRLFRDLQALEMHLCRTKSQRHPVWEPQKK